MGSKQQDNGGSEISSYIANELPRIDLTMMASKESRSNRLLQQMLLFLTWFGVFLFFPFSLPFCLKVVRHYERAVIFRFGKLAHRSVFGPGMFFVLWCVDTIRRVDMRTVSFDVPPQEVLTKDSVTVRVNAVVYYRVYDAAQAVVNVADVHSSTRLLAQSLLRKLIGTQTLTETLSALETISIKMMEQLDETTDVWGVTVERVEIKDVRLPQQMHRGMAAEAEAAREARAKLIAANGEAEASTILREAADVIGQSPGAMHLRYLQTLHIVGGNKNANIVFPVPMNISESYGFH